MNADLFFLSLRIIFWTTASHVWLDPLSCSRRRHPIMQKNQTTTNYHHSPGKSQCTIWIRFTVVPESDTCMIPSTLYFSSYTLSYIIFFVIYSVIHYILFHTLCHTLYSFSYSLSYIILFFIQYVIMKILVVILDSKLTLEKQDRAIAASASRKVVSLRKTMSVFRVVTVVAKCFWAFVLPVLEYCSPVWMSAATSLPLLLDRVVSQVSVSCDLWHRRKVASLSVFFKIDSLVDHPVRDLFPAQYVTRRSTRELLLLTLDLLWYQGLELCSFRALLFCLVFDCGMGCMNLSLLVKVSVLSKLQLIAFFYKICLPAVSSFSSTTSVSSFCFPVP